MERGDPQAAASTARALASELKELNGFEASQTQELAAEINSLKTPDEATMRQLAELAWRECWVDTDNKRLLWEARAGGISNLDKIEIIAAYSAAGDMPEGQALLDGISPQKLEGIEAALRFGSSERDGQIYIDREYLDRARRLAGELGSPQLACDAFGRIAIYSGDPEDYRIWSSLAAVKHIDPILNIENLLQVAAQGYLPALGTAKKLILAHHPMDLEREPIYQSRYQEYHTERNRYFEAAAKAEVIQRMIEQADTMRVGDKDAGLDAQAEKNFLKYARRPEVINILERGVELTAPLSPLEQAVLTDWQKIKDASTIKTSQQLWDYCSQRIARHLSEMKRQSAPDFKGIAGQIMAAGFRELINVPKRKIPETRTTAVAYSAHAAQVMNAHMRGIRYVRPEGSLPPGHISLSVAEKENIRQKYEAEDIQTVKDTAETLKNIDKHLLYRAVYYQVTGRPKVDVHL